MQFSFFNKRIRIRLREDRNVLLLSLGISLLFWFFVKLSQEYQLNRQVAISYLLPEGKAFVSQPPPVLRANFRGQGWDLLGLYFDSPVRIEVDAANQLGARINDRSLINRVAEAVNNRELEVVGVEYDQIRLNYENELARTLPVGHRLELEFAPEYQLRSPLTIKPDSVTVRGPESIIESLAEWPTDSVVIRGLRVDREEEIALVSPSTASIKLIPPTVTAVIPVEAYVEKSFFVPVSVDDQRINIDSIRIFPPSIRVSAVVGMSRYEDLKPSDFAIEVLLEDFELNSENNTAPLQMTRSPEYVRNVRFSPQSVEFIFSISDSTAVE